MDAVDDGEHRLAAWDIIDRPGRVIETQPREPAGNNAAMMITDSSTTLQQPRAMDART